MATRAQIVSQIRTLINEADSSNSHFTDTELQGFVDQAQTYLAVFIEHPRRLTELTAVLNQATYSLASDTVKIISVYFGSTSTVGDVKPLEVVSESVLKTIYPGWLDATTGSAGRPRFVMLKDKATLLVHPRPDSTEAGKTIHVNNVYAPAALSSDSSTPALPTPYHDVLPFYAAHLCYAKLGDAEKSTIMLGYFDKKVSELKSTVVREFDEDLQWKWANTVNINDYGADIIF